VPDDPYLQYSTEVRSSNSARRAALKPAERAVDTIVAASDGLDMVGIYAAGKICRGFANSFGQRNWHEVDNFNFDWCLYRQADQAVKTSYAGFGWNPVDFAAKMQRASEQVELLSLPVRKLEPGEYRAYLAPRALEDIMYMLTWGGFSARARQTKQSPLLRMQEGRALAARVAVTENTGEGIAPAFQSEGFIKPPVVTLISGGQLADALTSPRSAKEYRLATNGAGGGESPESMDLAAGGLAEADVLKALGTGLYISNLWYLNFSDRPAGRITGMTRFATFWVEQGKIVAPVTPMRFDDSVYRILGESLVDFTREREFLPDTSTYVERQTGSARLPGALLSALRFTL